jgi:hypothetical protein
MAVLKFCKLLKFTIPLQEAILAGDRKVRRLPTNWRFQGSQSRGKGEGDARITEKGGGRTGGGGGGEGGGSVSDPGLRPRRRFRKNADEGKST